MIAADTLDRWPRAPGWTGALPALPAVAIAALGWWSRRRRAPLV